jgi:dolichyl-phosphate-mannose--protein O-mannosyl transferase
VIWDEAHFGKFGSHYLKREFYFDVHPPLGKMLVGLAGLLSGYNGGYEFKSGEMYPEDVPFVAMRVILATFGVLMVPLGWYTAIELGMSTRACHLVALMCLCGTFFFILERVLGDPHLCDRCRMAGYFAFHSFGFYASLLYFHHRLRSFKVPQSTIPVRLGH